MFVNLVVGLEEETLSISRLKSVVKSIGAVLLGKSHNLNAGFDRSHLRDKCFSRAGLIAVQHETVTLGEAGFQESKGKSRAVSLNAID